METKSVEFTGKISEPDLESVEAFINGLGGQIFVERPLKFEDLGLAEIENDQFQCLACSRTFGAKRRWDARRNAVRHFKTLHLEKNPHETPKIQCPRCSEEVPKSNMNAHMEQKHEVKKFDQLMKRSFQPGQPEPGISGVPPKQTAKRAKKTINTELKADPLTTTADDSNNNMVKIDQPEPGTSEMPPKKTSKRAKKTIKTELEANPLTTTADDSNNNMVKIGKNE